MGMREKEEEEEKKKIPPTFVRGAPFDDRRGGVPATSWRGNPLVFSTASRPELQIARQRGHHSNVLDLPCEGRGHFQSTGGAGDGAFDAFPPSEALFSSSSTALSPSKGGERT